MNKKIRLISLLLLLVIISLTMINTEPEAVTKKSKGDPTRSKKSTSSQTNSPQKKLKPRLRKTSSIANGSRNSTMSLSGSQTESQMSSSIKSLIQDGKLFESIDQVPSSDLILFFSNALIVKEPFKNETTKMEIELKSFCKDKLSPSVSLESVATHVFMVEDGGALPDLIQSLIDNTDFSVLPDDYFMDMTFPTSRKFVQIAGISFSRSQTLKPSHKIDLMLSNVLPIHLTEEFTPTYSNIQEFVANVYNFLMKRNKLSFLEKYPGRLLKDLERHVAEDILYFIVKICPDSLPKFTNRILIAYPDLEWIVNPAIAEVNEPDHHDSSSNQVKIKARHVIKLLNNENSHITL